MFKISEASTRIYGCQRVGGKEVSYSLVQYFSDAVVYNTVEQLQFWESYVLKKCMLQCALHWAERWRTCVQGVGVLQYVYSLLGCDIKNNHLQLRQTHPSVIQYDMFRSEKDHLQADITKTLENIGVLISPQPDQERNKPQRQKILIFIYPIYNHNWRNIITIYICTHTHTYTHTKQDQHQTKYSHHQTKYIGKQVGLRTYQHPGKVF